MCLARLITGSFPVPPTILKAKAPAEDAGAFLYAGTAQPMAVRRGSEPTG